jgi:hypothetical protein
MANSSRHNGQSYFSERQQTNLIGTTGKIHLSTRNTKLTLLPHINAKLLQSICSPQISHVDIHNMSIFGIRLSTKDSGFSTGAWIRNPEVKTALTNHNVKVNISNSTCDSGNLVAAWCILLETSPIHSQIVFPNLQPEDICTSQYTLFRHRVPSDAPKAELNHLILL